MRIKTVGNLDKNYWRFIVSYVERDHDEMVRFERGFEDKTSAQQEFGRLRNAGKNAAMRPGFDKGVTP